MNLHLSAALPEQGEVDVWLLPLTTLTDEVRAHHESLLVAHERERASRFLVQGARDQYVAARALLRSRLSHYTGVPPWVWTFGKNEYGRPYLAEPAAHRPIIFNISHTEGLVTCAVCTGREVGIDTENTLRNLNFLSLAQSFFSPLEAGAMSELPESEARQAFFNYWTLKESYIKARGMGLSLPLDSFWFLLGERPRLSCDHRCGDNPNRWRFIQLRPTARHILSVAVEALDSSPIDVRIYWVDVDLFRRSPDPDSRFSIADANPTEDSYFIC